TVLCVLDFHIAGRVTDAGNVGWSVNVHFADVVHQGGQIVRGPNIDEPLRNDVDVGRVLGLININRGVTVGISGRIRRDQAGEVSGINVQRGGDDKFIGDPKFGSELVEQCASHIDTKGEQRVIPRLVI